MRLERTVYQGSWLRFEHYYIDTKLTPMSNVLYHGMKYDNDNKWFNK